MTHKRFASPILTDVGKESMLDLVPLAGARWEMTNRYDLDFGHFGIGPA